jgi:hypothetical protein
MTDTMTNDNTPRPPMVTTDEHFGGCPTCGKNDGYRNAGKGHWFFCLEHRVLWFAGANLFSSWHGETEAEQEKKFEILEGFERVKPIYPDARDMHIADVVWHRTQAKQHMDMAEEIEREHGLDPLDVAKQVEAAIVAKTNAPASVDDDLPF